MILPTNITITNDLDATTSTQSNAVGDTNESLNSGDLASAITGSIAVVIGIIGLVQGWKAWQRRFHGKADINDTRLVTNTDTPVSPATLNGNTTNLYITNNFYSSGVAFSVEPLALPLHTLQPRRRQSPSVRTIHSFPWNQEPTEIQEHSELNDTPLESSQPCFREPTRASTPKTFRAFPVQSGQPCLRRASTWSYCPRVFG